MEKNPFNLQFGKRPKQFLARQDVLDTFLNSLDDMDSAEKESLLVGIRGIGKTTLLSDIAESMKVNKQWVVINTFASDHITKDISDTLVYEYQKRFPKQKISGINIGAAGISVGLNFNNPSQKYGFATQFRILIDAFTKEDIGILFLVDELVNVPEVRDFLSNYQILLRENKKMALLLAGLPNNVSSVLNDKVLTFLWRINRLELGAINTQIILFSYEDIFENFEVSAGVLEKAAKLTQGYPYLYQLIGYYLFQFASDAKRIGEKELDRAIEVAKNQLFDKVLKLMYLEMSPKDQEIFLALGKLESPIHFSDVASQVGETKNYTAQYRLRLIELGVIREAGYGLVEFVVPFTKDFLKTL
ncbi:MAG: ATP-binding protein [Streptococcaceae bacterium]|jgi:hypothetical protein|nr:ATP-binding protein [Streptococcaceae bacterium]